MPSGKERIASRLAAEAWPSAVQTVRRIVLGAGFVAVQLDDGGVGAAFADRQALARAKGQGSGNWAGRTARDLISGLESENFLEAAYGLAAVNAVRNRLIPGLIPGSLTEAIRLKPGDRVGMVGLFYPLAAQLADIAGEVIIFEKDPPPDAPAGWLRPAEEALTALRDCDVAVITATTIPNGTIDGLLEAASGCREVVLLGPSTPLAPEAFGSTPMTCLSGAVIERPEEFMAAAERGDDRRNLKEWVRKVNLRL